MSRERRAAGFACLRVAGAAGGGAEQLEHHARARRTACAALGAMSCGRLRRMTIVTVFGHPHRLVTRTRAINVGADIN
ncbi:hypothetical protein [Burkholderia sp. F1]|uniref:hypothetical protein n=1 Tax=Burkholderia sp. F1 TaxID=3366817 RepID=UPI003D70D078